MSTVTQVNSTANQAQFNYDTSKIFIWNNRYNPNELLNASGADKDFNPGLVVGRVTATGQIVPLVSTATDGSEIPVGVLRSCVVALADAGTSNVSVCIQGDVAEEQLIFDNGTDTLDTVIDGRSIRDRLIGDTKGINPIPGDELTGFDNQ